MKGEEKGRRWQGGWGVVTAGDRRVEGRRWAVIMLRAILGVHLCTDAFRELKFR